MSDMQVRIDELKKTIGQATGELKKLVDQVSVEKSAEWVGLHFKVIQHNIAMDGDYKIADRLVSYYQIVGFDSWYQRFHGLRVEVAEYWVPSNIGVKIISKDSIDPHWLIQHGEVLSRAEFKAEIEEALRHALPFRVVVPPRPAAESMCPCPDCGRCCCAWVVGYDGPCVNFDEFGRCICEHEDGEAAAIGGEGQSGQGNLIILWLGMEEYEEFSGTLEEAIAIVNGNRRWDNYGRIGAAIVRAKKLYEIKNEAVEFFFKDQAAITSEEYQGAIATDEEIEAAIKKHEQEFGMSSEEFLEQVRLGTAPDEAGIIDWKLLLKYR